VPRALQPEHLAHDHVPAHGLNQSKKRLLAS
jgi:hypothetical protein